MYIKERSLGRKSVHVPDDEQDHTSPRGRHCRQAFRREERVTPAQNRCSVVGEESPLWEGSAQPQLSSTGHDWFGLSLGGCLAGFGESGQSVPAAVRLFSSPSLPPWACTAACPPSPPLCGDSGLVSPPRMSPYYYYHLNVVFLPFLLPVAMKQNSPA